MKVFLTGASSGLGVALAKRNWVDRDIEEGRLVRPFDLSLPVEFSYFLVYPESRAEDQMIATFVDWVRGEVAKDNAARTRGGV